MTRFVCILAGLWLVVGAAHAQGFYLDPLTADGAVPFPTDVEVRPDGAGYFVTDKRGFLYGIRADGTPLPEPILDLYWEVSSNVDRGLLGAALHPDFPARPDLYLYYVAVDETTRQRDVPFGIGRVVRYTLTGPDLWQVDPASRAVIFGESYDDGVASCLPFHAGGTIAFGPDGALFVSGGAGADAGFADVGGTHPDCYAEGRDDPADDVGAFRAQRLGSPNGKILRVDPETGLGLPDNPFYTGDPADWASRVWALGLRNPFRVTVAETPAGRPRLVIGDVGWYQWEELDVSTGGENFGWPCLEGPRNVRQYREAAPAGFTCDGGVIGQGEGRLTGPVAALDHYRPEASAPSGFTANSITGGAFYAGTSYPERYVGAYFFADFSIGWVLAGRLVDGGLTGTETIVEESPGFVDVEMDPAADALLLADIYRGRLVHLRHAGGDAPPPVAEARADARSGAAPFAVQFRGSRSFDPAGGALSYAWTFGDGASAAEADPVHTYDEVGTYVAALTVTADDGRQSQATVSVVVGRAAPTLTIVSPTPGVVRGNELVPLHAEVSDPYEPAEALDVEWEVRLVHNVHEHPGTFRAETARALFVALPHGEEGEVAFYEATATVTDGEGIRVSTSIALPLAAPTAVLVAATPVWVDGAARFGRRLRVRSVLLPGLGALPEGAAVEALVDGAWQPVVYPRVVVEPGGVRVLFVAVEADGLRVSNVDVEPRIRVDLGTAAGAPEGTVAGRLGDGPELDLATGADGALVLYGPASLGETDAAPFVYGPLAEGGAVTATVDGVIDATAGVMVRASLDPDARSAALLVDRDGLLTLRVRDADGVRVDSLGTTPLPARLWLYAGRYGLQAAVGADGEWALRNPIAPWEPTDLVGGLVLGSSGFAWTRDLRIDADARAPETSPTRTLAIRSVAPNPTTGGATVVIEAGRGGRHAVDVFDVLGRLVSTAEVVADRSEPVSVRIDLAGQGPGVYAVRARHVESGAAATRTLTVAR